MFEGNITFIGGSMRTGTSLLHSVLCGAVETNDMAMECFYLKDQLRLYGTWRQMEERDFTDFFPGSEGFKEFSHSVIHQLIELAYTQAHEPEHLILKNADTTLYFHLLMDILPQAKYIVSVRDPKDVVASMVEVARKQKDLGQGSLLLEADRDMEKLTAIYLSFYQNLFRSRSKHQGRVMFVRYEDLVRKPEKLIPDIAKFTNLDFSSYNPEAEWKYTRHREKNEMFDTESRGKRMTKSNIGNYKDILSTEEAQQVEKSAASFMKNFHYKTAT